MKFLEKKPVLLAAEMAAVDRYTIEEIGIPGAVLMEQAGKAVSDLCRQKLCLTPTATTLVLCGSGNNGGDGFVIARRLLAYAVEIKIILLGSTAKLKGDAKTNADICRRLGQKIIPFESMTEADFLTADLIIDALLGTGSHGALREKYAQAAKFINRSSARVVAVDLPTGVDADNGTADDNAVKADFTVTFGAAKPGLLFSPGCEYAGNLHVADIGFPQKAFAAVNNETFLLPREEMYHLLPRRQKTDFKNKCGQIFIIAGSEGMAGAAILTSSAALRAGAGLVVLAAETAITTQLATNPTEVVKEPLHWQKSTMQTTSLEKFRQRLQWADVVAIGPGLGQSSQAAFYLQEVLQNYHGPLVIDADGLNLLQGKMEILHRRKGGTILTPHPGEFLRLSGLKKEDIPPVPVAVARRFAVENRIILLFKGAPSIIALPDGQVFINCAGNPGMATAGMGDVLTGTIAGLAGQIPLENAALLGMFLHSRAADLAAKEIDQLALTAGDVLSCLAKSIEETRKQHG